MKENVLDNSFLNFECFCDWNILYDENIKNRGEEKVIDTCLIFLIFKSHFLKIFQLCLDHCPMPEVCFPYWMEIHGDTKRSDSAEILRPNTGFCDARTAPNRGE